MSQQKKSSIGSKSRPHIVPTQQTEDPRAQAKHPVQRHNEPTPEDRKLAGKQLRKDR